MAAGVMLTTHSLACVSALAAVQLLLLAGCQEAWPSRGLGASWVRVCSLCWYFQSKFNDQNLVTR